MMKRFLSLFRGGADSYTDQLNCRYTVFLLLLFAILATVMVYVDEPITCVCPTEFTNSMVSYANKFCWSNSVHWTPRSAEIPDPNDSGSSAPTSNYYHWIALTFCLQAFLCYCPSLIWRTLNRRSGMTVSTVTDEAIECRRRGGEGFDQIVKYVGQFLTGLTRRRPALENCIGLTICGSYLTVVYLIIKVVYVANILLQLILLDKFLSNDHHSYGFQVLRRTGAGEEWSTSTRFPRVTLCDFEFQRLGRINRYTVQCALPLNLFYEMMFIFLWFWMVFVVTVTLCSLVRWIVVSISFCFQESYIKARLVELDKITPADVGNRAVSNFTRNYLRRDGCFIIRLVSKKAGDRIAWELVAALWDRHVVEMESVREKLQLDETGF